MTIYYANPVAADDHHDFLASDTIIGNVLANDLPPSTFYMYMRDFNGHDVGAKKPGQITDIAGTYGTFHVKADGSYTYDLDPTVKANLKAGQSVTEKVSYKVSDGHGHTDVGQLSLKVEGQAHEPTPVTLDFEDVAMNVDGGSIHYGYLPDDYHGFYIHSPHNQYAPSDNAMIFPVTPDVFQGPGVSQVPGSHFAMPSQGHFETIIEKADHSTFDFTSGVFSGIYEIFGMKAGNQVYEGTSADYVASTHTFAPDWHDIDQVLVFSYSGLEFDDLKFGV